MIPWAFSIAIGTSRPTTDAQMSALYEFECEKNAIREGGSGHPAACRAKYPSSTSPRTTVSTTATIGTSALYQRCGIPSFGSNDESYASELSGAESGATSWPWSRARFSARCIGPKSLPSSRSARLKTSMLIG